ncbi:hypothetical protein SAMN05443247_05499 [Bradyrhizobium erythrophlei]|jgi:hypothetical protein|nr:hypothetical protein SAMN05443247_05499 [Bradyrhizobium erythrophlei]
MISVSDSELAALLDAARPIPPHNRDAFLRDSRGRAGEV